MIKKVFLLLIIFTAVFWFSEVKAQSYYYDSIDVEIKVNEDSTFDVTEEMTYNLNGSFGFFYRDIEVKDLDHFSDIKVFDSEGKEIFDYDKSYDANRLYIKWNFPRRDYVNELKSWTVQYKVHGGLGFFDDYDEIYWNAIFQNREVEVKKAKVIVNSPGEIIKARLFIGQFGTKKESSDYIIKGNSVEFSGTNISLNNFLTIVVSWPKGLVKKPFLYQNQIINLFVILLALLIPIIVFVRAFRKWWNDGRDPKITKTIIAHYEPPANLSPAVLGVLLKESVVVKDILATVVNLAVKGYIRIKEEDKKILFIKNKEYIFEKLKSEADLKPFEKEIVVALFSGKKSISSVELRNKFYKKIPKINKEIYKEVAKEGLFNGNLEEIRKKHGNKYLNILALVFFLTWIFIFLFGFLGFSLYIPQILIFAIGIFLSCVIGLIFAHFMPALTQKGLELKWQALGFREYLHTAERFRIGAETLETFSKFLPYAMILKVEKEWAERFSDFSYQDQSWYVPSSMPGSASGVSTPTSLSNFSSSFSAFSNSISSTFSSSPGGSGSGGGGSSGGGGGGGGGGAG
ncbi:MAG: DUF2207 domain-containing protein [Nanoarchaeota archaeon]|nr:DUF2207 domain-containing protein [Nanoarchaeota archaeon]